MPPPHAQQIDRSVAARLWNTANPQHKSSNPLGSSFEKLVLSWTREEVRKEWAEDANTMATQVWLPIRSPGRTKTTQVSALSLSTAPPPGLSRWYTSAL